MEKKNTILLTVIAIATLLVAVVGATFAYFTAQVNTDNKNNATTSARTYTLATATMDHGATISSKDGVYPGTVLVKPIVITGSCKDAKGCQDMNSVIKISAEIDDEFGTDVTWRLYKGKTANSTDKDEEGNYVVAAKNDEITCANNEITTGGKYYTEPKCNFNGTELNAAITDANTGYGAPLASGHATGTETYDLKVSGATRDTYYLVVEYVNHMDEVDSEQNVTSDGKQNDQQGHNYSVTVTYESAA